jgi:hypothetical protein
MDIRKHAATLAATLVIGAGILGLSAADAQAKPKKPGAPMVYCYVDNGNGDFDLYLPGDTIADGHRGFLKCGSDGAWDAVRTGGPASTTTAPTTTGGGVLHK